MRLIPNIPPKLFSFSAVAVGYILIDDTTANEQNALGNWLMLVAQVLCTNAYYKQVMAERGIGYNKNTSNPNNSNVSSNENEQTIQMLIKMVNALNKEINDIKNSM